MRKFMNDPERFADEALEGLLLAHPDLVTSVPGQPRAVVRADGRHRGRVAVATGGGSGHLPLFVGYVVRGLADGCAVGNMFASPSTEVMLAVTEAIDSGHGVLYLYGNYGGDRINFEAAAEFAADRGIPVQTLRCADDILSAPPEGAAHRRGIAGIFFGYAVAAGVARTGADLSEVARVTGHALSRIRSIGVALSGAVLPTVGKPNFELAEDEMEIGTGIHGEPGTRRGRLVSADELVAEMVPQLVAELDPRGGHEVAVLVNGLGATPPEELYVIYRAVHRLLADTGIAVRPALVGEYATSLEMSGASISLLQLDDTISPFIEAVSTAHALA
jgi:dihydroxyacetone kinase